MDYEGRGKRPRLESQVCPGLATSPTVSKIGYILTSAAGVLGERGEDMNIYRI